MLPIIESIFYAWIVAFSNFKHIYCRASIATKIKTRVFLDFTKNFGWVKKS